MDQILLVEDNESDAYVVKRILTETPDREFRVLCARNMLEALAILKTNRHFDIILLDLNLPDTIDEQDTYLRISAIQEKLPIVILTSTSDCSLALDSLDKGIEDYVIKSDIILNKGLLVEKIDYAIHRHKHYLGIVGEKESENQELMNYVSGGYSKSKSA